MSAPGTVALSIASDGAVGSIAFSPDSLRVAGGGGGSVVRVRFVATGPPLDVPAPNFVSDLAFSPDGSAIAVAELEQVLVRDSVTGAVRWQGPVDPEHSVNFVIFTPDGKGLIVATDTLVATFDAASGTPGLRTVVDQTIVGFDLSTDGSRLALAIDENHGGNHHRAWSARVFDAATFVERSRLTPDDAVFDVAFSPDGSSVLCGSDDGTARLFKADSGEEVWKTDNFASQLTFDPTGHWTVIGGSDGEARVVEAETGVEKTRVTHDGAVTHVAFSPNGRWAASTGIDNALHVFDVAGIDRYVIRDIAEVLAMRFSADSRWLGLGVSDATVVVDNGADGT